MFTLPKILFFVSLLFVALLNPKFNPYLLFKFLIFYHSSHRSIVSMEMLRCKDVILHASHLNRDVYSNPEVLLFKRKLALLF